MSRENHKRGDGTPRKGADKGAQEAQQAVRDAEALRLRGQRLTYREIGEQLGCHPATACKAYRRALGRLHDAADADAAAIREEQTAGLFESLEAQEEVLMRLRAEVVDEEVGSGVPLLQAEQLRKAEETYGRTWERVGKLWGTNAPTKVELDVVEASEAREKIEEALRRRREAKDGEGADAVGSTTRRSPLC